MRATRSTRHIAVDGAELVFGEGERVLGKAELVRGLLGN